MRTEAGGKGRLALLRRFFAAVGEGPSAGCFPRPPCQDQDSPQEPCSPPPSGEALPQQPAPAGPLLATTATNTGLQLSPGAHRGFQQRHPWGREGGVGGAGGVLCPAFPRPILAPRPHRVRRQLVRILCKPLPLVPVFTRPLRGGLPPGREGDDCNSAKATQRIQPRGPSFHPCPGSTGSTGLGSAQEPHKPQLCRWTTGSNPRSRASPEAAPPPSPTAQVSERDPSPRFGLKRDSPVVVPFSVPWSTRKKHTRHDPHRSNTILVSQLRQGAESRKSAKGVSLTKVEILIARGIKPQSERHRLPTPPPK